MQTNHSTSHNNTSCAGGSWRLFAGLLAVLALLGSSVNLRATTVTWTGAGTDFINAWGDVTNWDIAIPTNGYDVVFNGSTETTNFNNITNLLLNTITYNGSLFLNTGNAIVISNGIVDNSGFNTNNLLITLGQSQIFTANAGGAPLQFGGTINLTTNGYILTNSGSGYIYLGGVVSGSGSVVMNGDGSGNGVLRLGAANTFTKGLTINNGRVQMGNGSGIPSGNGNGDVTNNGTLDLNGNSPTINNLYGNSGGIVDNLAGTGTYTLTVGNNATNQGAVFEFDGIIQNTLGTLALTKVNTNKFILGGNSSYSGVTTVSAGTLALGASGSINGSSLIKISPGAVFDVSALGVPGYTIQYSKTLQAGRASGYNGDINGNLGISGSVTIYTPGAAGTMTITNGSLTLSGANLYFDLSTNASAIGGGTNDLINVTGAGTVNLSSTTYIALNPLGGAYGNGTYTLITAPTITGSAANLQGNALPRGVTATLGVTNSPGSVTVTVNGTASPASLVWQGGSGGGNWDVQTTSDWLNGGSPDYFYTFDNVVFNDTALSGSINVAQAVTPDSMVFNNSLTNYVINNGSAVIGGSGSLTKSGTATLTIRNQNSYGGPTIVNGGTLLLDFANSGTITSQILYSGVTNSLIMGGGTVSMSNLKSTGNSQAFSGLTVAPGSSILSDQPRNSGSSIFLTLGPVSRTNAGGTIYIELPSSGPGNGGSITTPLVNGIIGGYCAGWVNRGAPYPDQWITKNTSSQLLEYVHKAQEQGAAAFNTVTNNVEIFPANATPSANRVVNSVHFDNNSSGLTLTLSGTNVLTSGGVLVSGITGSGTESIVGGTLEGATNADLIVIQNSPGTLVINSTIADNTNGAATSGSALTLGAGPTPGTLALTGTNTYTGPTYVGTGTLQVGTGGIAGDLGFTPSVVDNGLVVFDRSDSRTVSIPVSGTGSFGNIGAGALTIVVNETYSGYTTNRAGTLQIGNGATSGSISNSVGLANSGTLIFNRSDTIGYPGPISGLNGSLVQQGAGVLVLGGTNTYGGATFVNNGQVVLGSAASISNTVAIVLAGGTTFDASAVAGGIVLNGAGAGQTVSGTGTIKGSITTLVNTLISPGTNGVIGTLTLNNDLNMSGGTLLADLSSTASHDLVTVNGNLNLNSGTIVINALNTLANGVYKLIGFSGSLGGNVANLTLIGFSQAGQGAVLAVNGNELDLVVTAVNSRNLTWAGDNVNNFWDVTTSDWLQGATSTVFSNFDNVTFDDTGSISPAVNIGVVVAPSVMVVNDTVNYTITGAGKISSSAILIKTNTGTLTIVNRNDYSGLTAINGGTLQVGDGSTLNSSIGAGPIAITNGANLVFNKPDSGTVPGNISGPGNLVQQGAGTLTLTGSGSLTGPTIVSGGILQVGAAGGTGSLGSGSVSNGTAVVFNRAGTVTQSGSITGPGSVTNLGSGTLILSAANTYTGGTTIVQGKVQLGVSQALPAQDNLIMNGGASSAGTFDLHGFNQTINGLVGANGTVNGYVENDAASTASTLSIINSTNATYSGTIRDSSGGGGTVGLFFSGPGNQTVDVQSAVGNLFSGGTIISNGTVTLTAPTAIGAPINLGAGPITLLSNATLFAVGAQNQNNGATWNSLANTINIPAGQTATIWGPSRGTMQANITGGGTLFYNTAYVRGQINGNWSGFTGQIIFGPTVASANDNGANLGINTTSGFQNIFCTNNVVGKTPGSGLILYNVVAGTPTISIGQLADDGTTIIESTSSGNAGGAAANFAVGGLNTSATYGGEIIDNVGIIKVGTGSWTLTGSTLTYSGQTTVSNGVLVLGASATIPNSATISIWSPGILDVSASGSLSLGAQTLQGNGTLNGSLTVGGTGRVLPGGANAIGTLTVTNAVSLGGSIVMELNETNAVGGTNDELVAQSINFGGSALTVTNIGSVLQAGDKFKLFSVAGTSTFGTITLPVTDHGYTYTWATNLTVDGTIQVLTVIANVNTNAFVMTNSFNSVNSTLTLSWPADHTGYRLLEQTNSTLVGLVNNTNDWFVVPNTSTTNTVVIPVSSTNGTVFFRLVYP
jgi:autotransporter-associated beta strand protein